MRIIWDANTEGGAAALSAEEIAPETEETMEEEIIDEPEPAKPSLKGFSLASR